MSEGRAARVDASVDKTRTVTTIPETLMEMHVEKVKACWGKLPTKLYLHIPRIKK